MSPPFTFITLLGLLAFANAGGITNFHCPTNGNNSVVIGCVQDCQQQHGAVDALCGDVSNGDHNCYCQGRSERVYQRSQLQCLEINDGYRNLCTFDCVCNHAAQGGHCVWDLGVCHCEPGKGNVNNIGCPAKTSDEYLVIARELIKKK